MRTIELVAISTAELIAEYGGIAAALDALPAITADLPKDGKRFYRLVAARLRWLAGSPYVPCPEEF